ncbi:ATP-binding cassette domain-containing protein [Emticicia sp. CRIBPO]|uniref:ABC transporter ATP-binding protein n=1 Tax=Emticicia sp. CRIBPO TaxID=2683258 RepID=UPI001411DC13|nr:ABC transporter ATP-binding protein [Emticicia sp. CRIBPO]NBA89051.1 ATP-binding cassette domain-containing protein [Emticicia sp. CRIBPO]
MTQNPYISLLRTAWKYAQHERRRYILIYLMFAVSSITYGVLPLMFGWFIDAIQRDNSRVVEYAGWYGIAYMILKLFEWAFHGPARVWERLLAFNLGRNFLREKYHQALHLPVKWHQDHHSGATINRIRKAYEALKTFFQNGFMYFYALSKFLFSFVAIIYYSPLFGGIGVLIGIFTVWVIFKFDKPFIKTLDEVNEKEHVISSTLFDSLSNIMTVITLRLEKSMENGLMEKVQAVLSPFRRNVIINEKKWFFADLLVALTYAVIAFGYVYQNWHPGQVFYVGGLVALLGYVNQFTSVFHDVAWQYTEIVMLNTDVQTARSIGESYEKQHRPEAQTVLPQDWSTIKIEGLNFSYQGAYDDGHAPQSLHNIHLNIKRGQRIAFIGESGSGKSTLLALLRGLYEAEPGFGFSVDGKKMNIASLNETVTLFPQEPEIFENTIEYNITLGLPFTETEVWEMCKKALFTETAEQLPNGLKSNIQEKGVNLSGGQKQRLALARGILAAESSQVVLLDEPTSSVDSKTEALIYERLFEAFSDKAVISSLHRLHLLRHFDYVYILGKGRVVAEGTFEELRAGNAIFQDLWMHQERLRTD